MVVTDPRYAGKYGFGCDTVVNFEVVLADGSIVNANASSSPDLWQALKGGHGNLGLVTRFDMQAITSTKIWGGPHIYHNNASIAVVEAVTKFIDGSADDPASSAMTIWTYMPQTKQTVILSAIINTDGVDDASVLQDFRNAQPLLFATPRHDTHAGIVKDFDFAIGYQ